MGWVVAMTCSSSTTVDQLVAMDQIGLHRPWLILFTLWVAGCDPGSGTLPTSAEAVATAEPPALSERISEFFKGELGTCAEFKAWLADHPETMVARDTVDGLELLLRNIDPLVACCDDRDWIADLDDPAFVADDRGRGQSQLFVLSVRTRRPLSEYGAMFDSLRADNVIRRWFLMEGTDTVPCVFVQQEATGELVPGIDLLLGFDIRTSSRDQRILFRGAGLLPHDLYFDYDRSSLRELNDRLPAELKDPEDPRRT